MRATRALNYIPAPPRPPTLASSLRVGPRGGGGLLRKSLHVERFNYHITTQPTPRLRDMPFSRRTHTQLKNEHDTKSHETGTRDARARMRHSLRWITAVPASTQPAAATAVVLDAAD